MVVSRRERKAEGEGVRVEYLSERHMSSTSMDIDAPGLSGTKVNFNQTHSTCNVVCYLRENRRVFDVLWRVQTT